MQHLGRPGINGRDILTGMVRATGHCQRNAGKTGGYRSVYLMGFSLVVPALAGIRWRFQRGRRLKAVLQT